MSQNELWDDTKGRCPSNTYPPTSHVIAFEGEKYSASGGLDWFGYSFGVQWHELRHGSLMDVLVETKAKLQLADEEEGLCFLPGFGEAVLSRSGYRWGGARGQQLDFKLKIDGTEVGLSRSFESGTRNANVVVKQTGRDCLLWGGRERYEQMRSAIECLGCRIIWEKLSRADLAVDIAGLSVETLQDLFDNDQFITRCRTTYAYHNRVANERTGFHAGQSPCRLVVYDKRKETKKKLSVEYITAMIDRRWGGTEPEFATRVEWQVSRSKLTKLGVNSPADFFERQGSVFANLMTDYFRLTNEVVDRQNNNQSRCTVHPLWSAITDAGSRIFASSNSDLTPIERGKVQPLKALRTARGHIKSALYDYGVTIETYEQFMTFAIKELQEIGDSDAAILADKEKFVLDYQRGFIARGLDDVACPSLEEQQ